MPENIEKPKIKREERPEEKGGFTQEEYEEYISLREELREPLEFVSGLESASKEDKDKVLHRIIGREKIKRFLELGSKVNVREEEKEYLEFKEQMDRAIRSTFRDREKGDEEKLDQARIETERAFEEGEKE
jgi:hypothetical protein